MKTIKHIGSIKRSFPVPAVRIANAANMPLETRYVLAESVPHP